MSGKRSNFVLEKSGKPQSDFCTNPVYLAAQLMPCSIPQWFQYFSCCGHIS